ncbi:hypothetical protein ACOME3_009717 [Neoechinorhynchus agilis]
MELSMDEKYNVDDLVPRLDEIEWEAGEYVFPSFIEYFPSPQIIRVEQNWHTDLPRGRYMALHSLFDRYSIIATKLKDPGDNRQYILTDWFRGDCRVASAKPKLKQRWWVFQGAFELYRFELPRRIKVLAESPAHMHEANDKSNEWKKVVLKKNVILTTRARANYKPNLGNTDSKEGFILADDKGNEYLIPPAVPFRFATPIADEELHREYKNHDGKFSVPEILMRYDFPIDIELLEPEEQGGQSLGVYRFYQFSVTKSVIGAIFGRQMDPQLIELSPLLQFTLHCPKCITCGLPREDGKVSDGKAEPNEIIKYEKLRKDVIHILNAAVERYKSGIRVGNEEEVMGIERAYEISLQLERDQSRIANSGDAFLSTEEAISLVKNQDDVVPFASTQPKTFTVHACIDPTNPYNEAIDYEVSGDESTSKNGTPSGPAHVREALVMQAAPLNPIPR